MATESIIIELTAEHDWNGLNETPLSRDRAVVSGRRHYAFTLSGVAPGILPADLGGLFSPVSAKLVGVAYTETNPRSKARVVTGTGTNVFRQELMLHPGMQYVVLYPNDRLAFRTLDGGRGKITLTVNEMSEQDALVWGLQHSNVTPRPVRYRIVRATGAAFVAETAAVWQPQWIHDLDSDLLVATENGTGLIPTTSLSLYPRGQTVYVSIRYAGSSGDGKLLVVDNHTRKGGMAEIGLGDVKWSRVQAIGYDDYIALEATPAVAGSPMVCDIEVAPADPNRLARRHEGGL